MNAQGFRLGVSRSTAFAGVGMVGGLPAVDDGPDGLLRRMNVPFRGRVFVLERSTMNVVASTLSAPNGQWRIGGLSPAFKYMVIGVDGAGTVNAAIQDWVTPYVAP